MKKLLKKQRFTILEIILLLLLISYFLIANHNSRVVELPKGFEKAKVNRIIDGDTFEVDVSGIIKKVRIIGVNTPELPNEYFATEAESYAKIMLLNKNIYLEKDISEVDKYNRLLRYIWLEIPNKINDQEIKSKMYNAIILEKGYAKLATYKPDIKYIEYFKIYNKEAKEKNVGVWKKQISFSTLFIDSLKIPLIVDLKI